MKCPLCDGPVSGGRCRDCGMPYRNDELRYHLNEDQRTHESHVSEKIKKELQKNLGNTISHEEIRQKQQAVRQEAVERMTAGRMAAEKASDKDWKKKSTGKKSKKKEETSWKKSFSGKEKKKNSFLRWFFVILTILVLASLVFEEEPEDTSFESVWTNADGSVEYGFSAGFGYIEADRDLPSGTYRIYTDEEELTLVYESGTGGEEITLREDESIVRTVEEGDFFYLENEKSDYDSVYFQRIED